MDTRRPPRQRALLPDGRPAFTAHVELSLGPADTGSADPRDEGFARWLVDTDKVVLSSPLGQAPWERTRIVDKPAAEVAGDPKATKGGDVLVLSSVSVIKALLAAEIVDRPALTIFPVSLGCGPRLFDDGLPKHSGRSSAGPPGRRRNGTLSLVCDRIRTVHVPESGAGEHGSAPHHRHQPPYAHQSDLYRHQAQDRDHAQRGQR